MSDRTLTIGMLLLSVFLIWAMVYFSMGLWEECKNAGFSNFYCLRTLSR